MKKILFYSTILIGTLVTASSCEKFFALTPDYEVPVDNVYKTDSDFELAVNGCYAKLQGQVNFATELCEFRSDNLKLSAPTIILIYAKI